MHEYAHSSDAASVSVCQLQAYRTNEIPSEINDKEKLTRSLSGNNDAYFDDFQHLQLLSFVLLDLIFCYIFSKLT